MQRPTFGQPILHLIPFVQKKEMKRQQRELQPTTPSRQLKKIIKSEIYKANPDIPSPTFESPPSECLNISSYCAATPETPRSTA